MSPARARPGDERTNHEATADTFEFDQGHVTKNQPITELILSSESLAK